MYLGELRESGKCGYFCNGTCNCECVFGDIHYFVFVKADVLDSGDIEVVCDAPAHNASFAICGVKISNGAGGDGPTMRLAARRTRYTLTCALNLAAR